MYSTVQSAPACLRVYLIKPSKYENDGSVLTFWKGILPSNTLTVLNALVLGWNDHRSPGLATRTETVVWDEVVHGAVGPGFLQKVSDETKAEGTRALFFVCGAQTNEYFRARDIALWLRSHGHDCVVGGFHISGHKPSRDYLNAQGISTVVGEAEGQISIILEDAIRGRLRPNYEHDSGLRAKTGRDPIWVPDIEDAPLPVLDRDYLSRMMNPTMTTLDTSRGCPFTCSYCSVKNVMGRTMRSRDPRAVQDWLRRVHDEHGIRYVFLVDDNFYRNPRWEEILDGLIELRREGRSIGFMMQVDVEASGGLARAGGEREASAARFLEKSAAAGCYQVFVGFESFNASNLAGASKHQNVMVRRSSDEEQARAEIVERYRRVVANWHGVGIGVHGAGMIGFPWDGPDAGRRMAQDFIDMRLDQASFFIVTPLPGTEDWDAAIAERRVRDFDFDHYATTQPVAVHPRMSHEELLEAYHDAIDTFYHPKRLLTYLLTNGWNRHLSSESRTNNVRQFMWYFFSRLRNRHPMIGGFWRHRKRGLKGLMSVATVEQTESAGDHLEAIIADLRAWRDKLTSSGAKERLADKLESLAEVFSTAFDRIKRMPVGEDHTGVKPISYVSPHIERLVSELRELARKAESHAPLSQLPVLLEDVEARLQQKWLALRKRGAQEARLLEEVLLAWRLGLALEGSEPS